MKKPEWACKVKYCGKKIHNHTTGFCEMHHRRYTTYGTLDANGKKITTQKFEPQKRGWKKCKVEGCGRKQNSLGFCQRHYNDYRFYKKIDFNGYPITEEKFKNDSVYNGDRRNINVFPPKRCYVEGCNYRECKDGLCHLHLGLTQRHRLERRGMKRNRK